jgi:NAD(P)-dependent dehydrogenase (short-subunit alcohol dehydrogenase family)
MAWSTDDLPDMTGTVAIVTGANSGIGFHTAKRLAEHGAEVVLACRDTGAARAAAAKVPGRTRVEELDLASLASVRGLAERWDGPVDLLVNNAGVMAPPQWRATKDGHELQFGTNHLGHFALTGLLLANLLDADAPRVVTVSSLAHHNGRADVVDGNPAERYRPESAYGNSKLANLLFALELQRRATAHGTRLTSTAAHPGVAATGLVPDREGMGANAVVRTLGPLVVRVLFQSASAGADPVLYAATAAAPASYSGAQRMHERRGPAGPAAMQPLARDEDLAARLWDASEALTGVSYHWPGP